MQTLISIFQVKSVVSTMRYLLFAGLLVLAGCQSELYSNLAEREANEMITVLAASGISASRTTDGKGTFGLTVSRSDFSSAVATLSEQGLPRENFGSLGKVFSSDKLVSTPFEERARFMHALNQELSDSITRINGVVSARVHLMVPEASPFDKNRTPPRASVFIYQKAGTDLSVKVPVIKNLIVNSMENLEYSNVEVALFAGATDTISSGNSQISSTAMAGFGNILLILVLGALAWFGFKYTANSGAARKNVSIEQGNK
jgi:type III secretion protein J